MATVPQEERFTGSTLRRRLGQGAEARAGLHPEVLHRPAKAAPTGRLDSTVAAAHAQQLIAGDRRTTPMTWYGLNMDGPFGDTDPSVYF